MAFAFEKPLEVCDLTERFPPRYNHQPTMLIVPLGTLDNGPPFQRWGTMQLSNPSPVRDERRSLSPRMGA